MFRQPEPFLTIKGLSVGYGQSLVLTDVALDVPEGQVVCLMGRNGVGKTTLLKAIMGLLNPRAGQIRFGQSRHDAMGAAQTGQGRVRLRAPGPAHLPVPDGAREPADGAGVLRRQEGASGGRRKDVRPVSRR